MVFFILPKMPSSFSWLVSLGESTRSASVGFAASLCFFSFPLSPVPVCELDSDVDSANRNKLQLGQFTQKCRKTRIMATENWRFLLKPTSFLLGHAIDGAVRVRVELGQRLHQRSLTVTQFPAIHVECPESGWNQLWYIDSNMNIMIAITECITFLNSLALHEQAGVRWCALRYLQYPARVQ